MSQHGLHQGPEMLDSARLYRALHAGPRERVAAATPQRSGGRVAGRGAWLVRRHRRR